MTPKEPSFKHEGYEALCAVALSPPGGRSAVYNQPEALGPVSVSSSGRGEWR